MLITGPMSLNIEDAHSSAVTYPSVEKREKEEDRPGYTREVDGSKS